MKYNRFFQFLATLQLIALISCKKHDTPPTPPPTCLISLFTDVAQDNGTPHPPAKFTYDQQGRLIRIDDGDNIKTINYTPEGCTVTNAAAGIFAGITVVTNNKDGLALNVHSTTDPQGILWTNTSYQYNGQELAKSSFTNFAMSDPVVTTYRWSAGNLISSTTQSITQTYEYYTDKLRQQGDYLYFQQFPQGYELFRNKNLVRSGQGLNFIYEFGSDGKITAVKATPTSGGNDIVFKYDYNCN